MEEELTEVLLPLNNKYVKEFLVLPIEKQLQILKLGILTYKFSEQRFKTVIDNEKEDIIEKLTSQHSKEIEEVKLVNSSLKTKIVNLETKNKNQYNEFRNTIDETVLKEKEIIKKNLEISFNEKIDELKEKISQLEKNKEILHQSTLSQQKNFYDQLLSEKEKANQLIDKVRLDCDIKIEEYRNKLDEFQKVNQNSTLKGQRGEDLMYNMLVEQFPGCQIDTHTSKESHKGDFSLIDDTHHGMIESKNYKKNVPKNEIQKFYHDIENNNDIDYAILCSLKSGVANKPKDFTLEFIAGRPVIFLHKVKDNKQSIKLAYTICKLILKNMQCFDITKEENQIKIKQIVKSYLQNHKKLVSLQNDHNKKVNKMMSDQLSSFNNLLDIINIVS